MSRPLLCYLTNPIAAIQTTRARLIAEPISYRFVNDSVLVHVVSWHRRWVGGVLRCGRRLSGTLHLGYRLGCRIWGNTDGLSTSQETKGEIRIVIIIRYPILSLFSILRETWREWFCGSCPEPPTKSRSQGSTAGEMSCPFILYMAWSVDRAAVPGIGAAQGCRDGSTVPAFRG
ncbi:hypothetical protein F5B21DRAFT_294358 [Xylaria acuta]|nr:hypothetical protein F5B21DRAFT_294358 [Xylaria acuta]